MPYLLDTNIFLRLATKRDVLRPVVLTALKKLRAKHEPLYYTPQVLSEFWNVCTRPATARGGIGLSVIEADRKARSVERYFQLLPDNLATHQEWRQLVVNYSVKGVQAYDAKLVASMSVYGISYLLTFNTSDFKRYVAITAVDPNSL